MNQSNLTFEDHERLAWISGQPIPEWMLDHSEDLDDAATYKDTALDFRGIDNADDLKTTLDRLYDLETALPDGVDDADSMRVYVNDQEQIEQERDIAMGNLEILMEGAKALALKAKKQRISGAALQGLYEWIYYAANEHEAIDSYHFKRDLDIL